MSTTDFITEDDVLEIENNSTDEITEDEIFSPVVCEAWDSSDDFVKYIAASTRKLPPIYENSKNSLRRTQSYLKKIQAELINGVEQDADYAELSEDQIKLIDGIEEGLEETITQIASYLNNRMEKKAAFKATKFTYVVTPFLFGIARVMINGKVSQGKKIEELYETLNEKFKLSDREKLELLFLLSDMGYPINSSFVNGIDRLEQYYS